MWEYMRFFFYLVNWRIVIYNIMLVFARRQHESAVRICVPPHPESPSPPYPFRLSQKTGFGCLASCIKLALVIYFTRGNVYALMLFSQIIPPSPSSTESKSLCFTSMSPLLPCMQDCPYHLSKFHTYASIILFIYLFLAVLCLCCCTGVSLAASLWLWCTDFSLWSKGSRAHRLQWLWHVGSVVVACGIQSTSSIVVAHGLSCFMACRILSDQGSNPCLLHWQVDSLPQSHQEVPCSGFFFFNK